MCSTNARSCIEVSQDDSFDARWVEGHIGTAGTLTLSRSAYSRASDFTIRIRDNAADVTRGDPFQIVIFNTEILNTERDSRH